MHNIHPDLLCQGFGGWIFIHPHFDLLDHLHFFYKNVSLSLASRGSLTTNVCKCVRKFTRWLFHCFYKIKFSRFYSLTLANRTFCTSLSSSESSKTPYRFAPLNILVVLLSIAKSYVVLLVISYVVLPVIEEDWFTILLNMLISISTDMHWPGNLSLLICVVCPFLLGGCRIAFPQMQLAHVRLSHVFRLANLFGIMPCCAIILTLLKWMWFRWMCHLNSSSLIPAFLFGSKYICIPSCAFSYPSLKLNGWQAPCLSHKGDMVMTCNTLYWVSQWYWWCHQHLWYWSATFLSMLPPVNSCILILHGVISPKKSLLCLAMEYEQQLSIAILYESESNLISISSDANWDAMQIIHYRNCSLLIPLHFLVLFLL